MEQEQADKKLKDTLTSINQSQLELEAIEAKKSEAQKALDNLNLQSDLVTKNLEDKKSGIKTSIVQLTADMDRFISQSGVTKEVINSQIQELYSEIKSVNEAIERAKAQQVSDFVKAKSKYDTLIFGYLNQEKELIAKIDNLKSEYSDLTNQVNNANKILISVNQDIDDKNIRLSILDASIFSKTADLENLNSQQFAIESKVKESIGTIQINKLTIENQVNTISTNEQTLSVLKSEIVELENGKAQFIQDKISLSKRSTELDQREIFIKNAYKVAGITY